MWHDLLSNARFLTFLLEADRDLAAEMRRAGCRCGGVLHQANYERKPRGGPDDLDDEHTMRFSFCCAEEGCRRRATPPSLRFLGRRVYFAAVVVLASIMRHGATPERLRRLHEVAGVSGTTVVRWRRWWRSVFTRTAFWRAARAVLVPPVAEVDLPDSLLARFRGTPKTRLVALLRFLGPIAGGAAIAQAR